MCRSVWLYEVYDWLWMEIHLLEVIWSCYCCISIIRWWQMSGWSGWSGVLPYWQSQVRLGLMCNEQRRGINALACSPRMHVCAARGIGWRCLIVEFGSRLAPRWGIGTWLEAREGITERWGLRLWVVVFACETKSKMTCWGGMEVWCLRAQGWPGTTVSASAPYFFVFLLLPLTNSERWYLFIAPLTTTCSYVSLFNIFPLFVTWQVAVSYCAASGFACVIACCRFPLENYLWLKLETIRTAQQCSKVLGSRINCLQGCESFRATTYSSNSVTCIPCQNGWRHLSAVK